MDYWIRDYVFHGNWSRKRNWSIRSCVCVATVYETKNRFKFSFHFIILSGLNLSYDKQQLRPSSNAKNKTAKDNQKFDLEQDVSQLTDGKNEKQNGNKYSFVKQVEKFEAEKGI